MTIPSFKQLDRPSQLSQFNYQIVACKTVPLNQIVGQVAQIQFAAIFPAKEESGYFVERLVETPTSSSKYTQIDNFDIYSDSYPSIDCRNFKQLQIRAPSLKELRELNDGKDQYSLNYSEYFEPGITSKMIQRQYLKAMGTQTNNGLSPTGITNLSPSPNQGKSL